MEGMGVVHEEGFKRGEDWLTNLLGKLPLQSPKPYQAGTFVEGNQLRNIVLMWQNNL